MKNTVSFNKALLTPSDTAAYMNISVCSARSLINNEPGFPVVKINTRKYVNKELLDEWLNDHTVTIKKRHREESKNV